MKIKDVKQEGELVTLLLEGQTSFVRIVFKCKQQVFADYPDFAALLKAILSEGVEVVEMVEI